MRPWQVSLSNAVTRPPAKWTLQPSSLSYGAARPVRQSLAQVGQRGQVPAHMGFFVLESLVENPQGRLNALDALFQALQVPGAEVRGKQGGRGQNLVHLGTFPVFG